MCDSGGVDGQATRPRWVGAVRHLRGAAVLLVVGHIVLAVLVLWWWRPEPGGDPIRVSALSAEAQAGKRAFDLHCAPCHGENAAGTAAGPALVHRIYQPGHHADVTFELAVRRGVPAHHWRFGDMPAQPAVAPAEVAQITRYVRELQRANGLE
jgi:mono/diheme cytochrome c family protein